MRLLEKKRVKRGTHAGKTKWQILKEWRARNPEKYQKQLKVARDRKRQEGYSERVKVWSRRGFLKYHYGLTVERLSEEIEKRFNTCDICGRQPAGTGNDRNLHIDHKPGTLGSFRGLLCGNCNRGIGQLQDSPALLQKAARYILEHP